MENMAMDKIRVGMIGVGGFGVIRRAMLKETGMYKLVVGYDIDYKAIREAVKEDGCEAASSLQELVSRDDIEAVIISTGAKFHAEHCLAAANAGKHIFVEKPLCSTLDESRQILSLCRKKKLKIGMGHEARYERGIMTCKKYIENERLGKIVAIEINTSHSGALATPRNNWRFDPEKNPGGMLFQCGIHYIDTMHYLFGPIIEVASFMRADICPDTKTDDASVTILKFKNGLIGSLNAHHTTAYNHYIYFYGTKGNLYYHESPERVYFQKCLLGKTEKRIRLKLDKSFRKSLALVSFANALRRKTDPVPSGLDGAKALAVVAAAKESSDTGKIVVVHQVANYLNGRFSK
jgi:predicted dehydrogenase